MALIDTVDTYALYIEQQVQKINPARVFAGVVNAQGWPLPVIQFNALYLLVLGEQQKKSNPRSGMPSTLATTLFMYDVQWVWNVLGSVETSASSQVCANSQADAYRTNAAIQEELRQAHYPQFCNKNIIGINYATTPPSASVQLAPPSANAPTYDVPEQVRWGEINFRVRLTPNEGGVTYGSASVQLQSYSQISPLVA